ncbi:D-alanyl-D-alanine carboxypeptidase [Patescibacteria group bacterium]|nr:D-alanyl-D-alanine carboxypeptidase [Patescibacteria group bacterium]
MSKRHHRLSPVKLILLLIFLTAGWYLTYRVRLWQAGREREWVLGESTATPLYESLWRPQVSSSDLNSEAIEFGYPVKAALSVDFESGQVYYARNVGEKLSVASLTKIMTAMVTLDHAVMTDVLIVPQEALDGLPEDSSIMGISIGEKYTVKDLLYGLLLPSGNDAARTLAIGLAGSQENFVYWMNRRAQSLGLKNTHFANPSGLDDLQNYSTVRDLAILTHYALTNYPDINFIVGQRQYEISHTSDHKYIFFGNFNDLMLVYDGVDGVKPGNTAEAGSCLIATATQNGRRTMAIVLGSIHRNAAAIKLLDLGK